MADKFRNSHRSVRIPVIAFGESLSAFFVMTFTLAVLFDLWVPGSKMYGAWLSLVPGFTTLDWTSFSLGFLWSFLTGWYAALIAAPLFNFVAARLT